MRRINGFIRILCAGLGMPVLLTACLQQPLPQDGIAVSDENNNTVTTQAIPTNGLKGDYYDNIDFTGTLKTRYDATINKAWNSSAPITGIQPTTYSVRWTGQIMPAFSETYTFYVTSSDGARLMVNGQVLVNDWKDGSSRVRSGTVALQANTKYDIRLEYYRNATNPGAVKLEWQSSSRSKQVVPQASLFTTGSNLQAALSAMTSNSDFAALGVVFDLNRTVGTLNSYGRFNVIALEKNSKNFSIAAVKGATVDSLIRFKYDNGVGELRDFVRKSALSLGAMSQFFSSSGGQTSAQNDALVQKIAAFWSGGEIQARAILPASIGGLRPQGNVVDFFCDKLQPPPDCDILCKDAAKNYRDAICKRAAQAENLIETILFLPESVLEAVLTGSIPDLTFDPTEDRNKYYECLNNPPRGQKCEAYAEISPLSISGSHPVNSIGIAAYQVIVRSLPESDRFLEFDSTIIKYDPADNITQIIAVVPPNEAPYDDSYYDLKRFVLPDRRWNININFRCPATPKIMKANLVVNHNASNIGNRTTIPIEINCVGGPQISVSPNPFGLSTAINQSVIGVLTVTNQGTSPLEVSSITANSSWLSVSTSSFTGTSTIPNGSNNSRTVSVTGTCGATVETRLGSITVQSNDPNQPSVTVPVTLACETHQELFSFSLGSGGGCNQYPDFPNGVDGYFCGLAVAWFNMDYTPAKVKIQIEESSTYDTNTTVILELYVDGVYRGQTTLSNGSKSAMFNLGTLSGVRHDWSVVLYATERCPNSHCSFAFDFKGYGYN
jgi:PA14 domain